MNNCCDGGDPYFVYDVDELPKTCDKKTWRGKCDRKAYMEVYWKSARSKSGIQAVSLRHWSYLCRYHYYIDRIKNFIFRWRNWYCDIDD